MSEMIERVAKAIEAALIAADEETLQLEYCFIAKAAIEAMRKPADLMLAAGDSMLPQIADGQDCTGVDALADAWPAMIDAALSEEG